MNVGTPRTAARLIVDALERNGIERIFCVPGESYLALLDALYDSTIPLTVCRHEGGAARLFKSDSGPYPVRISCQGATTISAVMQTSAWCCVSLRVRFSRGTTGWSASTPPVWLNRWCTAPTSSDEWSVRRTVSP